MLQLTQLTNVGSSGASFPAIVMPNALTLPLLVPYSYDELAAQAAAHEASTVTSIGPSYG